MPASPRVRRGDTMCNPGGMKFYDELLELLAEEQNLCQGPLRGNDLERREYRRERIRELMLQLRSLGTKGRTPGHGIIDRQPYSKLAGLLVSRIIRKWLLAPYGEIPSYREVLPAQPVDATTEGRFLPRKKMSRSSLMPLNRPTTKSSR